MQDDTVCPQERDEPRVPTDEEIKDAIENFDILTDSCYDDDYIEIHVDGYRYYLRVYKWFKDEYDRYRELSNHSGRVMDIMRERIKWLEIENENLQTEILEMRT